MTVYAKRKDANHDEIKAAMTDAGWQCEDTYQFAGVLLDIIANKDGVTVLVECKVSGNDLTPRERKIFNTWHGPAIIAYSPGQAVAQLREISVRYVIVHDDAIPF
jgi:hypothetical protein